MALISLRAPHVFFGASLVLLAGLVDCGGLVADDAESESEVSSALTTPTGANWIVLPRPPARVSRIYADAYAAPFAQSAANATITTSTTTKTEGANALSVKLNTANATWGAAINASEAPYSAAGQTELSFAFNAGASVHAGIATLQVALDDDDAGTALTYVPLKPLLTSGTVAANTWYRVTIPMTTLNPQSRPIRRVIIANQSALTNVTFFLDDVKLSWTDAAPTERLVYTDSAQGGFSASGWSVTNATNTYRTTGASALRSTFTASWGALALIYDWSQPAFPIGTHTTVSFDISGGSGTPPAALANMYVGLDGAPTKKLLPYIPGGFKANTWHRVTIPVTDLVSSAYRYVTFKNESTSLYSFFVDHVRFETDHAPPPLRDAVQPPGDPDTFAAGEVDVVTNIKTAEERKAISPLIYGINGFASSSFPANVLAAVTMVRRGGDRGNSYNWETGISNGSYNNGFVNDTSLATGGGVPAGQDLSLLSQHRPAGRAVLVPFVLNDFVSGPVGGIGAYDQPGWNRSAAFVRNQFVKPTAFAASPNLNDGVVYTDEHLQYMRNQYPGVDITAPGPGQLIVGIDNEPDLYHYNFPMLQDGTGDPILASNGTQIGRRVSSDDFTARMISFAKKVKQMAPQSTIVGPSHYHFDGWTTWHMLQDARYSSKGRWYMDDFLPAVASASATEGKRLLDVWDFHWYPQRVFNGTYTWNLDNAVRTMTQAEIDAVVQGPRSYWDPTYDELSWITSSDHLAGPAYIINRLLPRIAAGYPGTKIGVTEYNPGGRNHVSSGLAVADSLGVFARLGVQQAAFWPVGGGSTPAFGYGGLVLLRNADGAGLKFAATDVKVEHPEIAPSSVYAGMDTPDRVTVLVINKTNAARKFGLRAFNTERLASVDAWRLDATHSTPFLASSAALTKVNAYAYTAPAMSATLLVFKK